MKRLPITIAFAIALSGCQPFGDKSPVKALSEPARFELRDFKLDEQDIEYGARRVTGRGTLVALDEKLKKGNFVVWITVKQQHKNGEQAQAVLILRDGLTTVETHDYVTKADRDKIKVRYEEWRMTGYIPMQEGVIVAEAPVPTPSTQAPQPSPTGQK